PPHQSKTPKVTSPPNCAAVAQKENLDVAAAEIIARRNQPTTSLIAAAVIVTTPRWVRVKPNSRRILPNVGTAVMAIATAKNEQYVIRSTSGASTGADNQPTRPPSNSGMVILAAAMLITADRFRFWARWPNSKSLPIWNIRRIRPIWLIIPIG